jgi:carboxyl-terminal processing protease
VNVNTVRSRALISAAVLSGALVSGGWLVERGLIGGPGGAGNGADGARLYDEVFQHVKRDYVDTLTDSLLYVNSVEGLVGELHDPHSSYLSPQTLARLSETTSGRYAGVGAQIDVRDGWITIVAPLPGGPALAAGVRTGDRIIDVNGSPMKNITVEEAQKALRGTPGSKVRLTVERPGVATPLNFELTRREIRVHSVQHATLLANGVGYVALTVFSEQSAPDLRLAVDSLLHAGAHSLLLDLRSDPGGLLDQGVGVADLFLDPGQRIVSMRGRTPDADRSYADREPQAWPTLPIAVLVDSNTASAAEIVAGALQDHDRALLLGTTTYGKGSAQNVFPTEDGGAVKLTTALWYTPSGRSINRRPIEANPGAPDTTTKTPPSYRTDAGRVVLGGGGITPDVVIPTASITAADSALGQALGNHVPQFQDALTDYARSLEGSHAVASPDFVVTPAMRAELLRRLASRGVKVDSAAYQRAAPTVDRVLADAIARYVFGDDAAFARRLRSDSMVARAVAIEAGATTPAELLRRAPAAPAPKPR